MSHGVNAFKTYGGLGFFHGGATLQEIIIPVIYAEWPQKTTEITIVLKPVQFITSLTPRVQIEDGGRNDCSEPMNPFLAELFW